ncbi:MAG: hypothetical protein M1392_00745 [Gammaproteobacteria bacterium]|nr:hypothetical protein [Gammaproteobacteria bacterium]
MSKKFLMLLGALVVAIGLAACEKKEATAPAGEEGGQTMEQPAEGGGESAGGSSE